MSAWVVADERPADRAAVRRVEEAAFGRAGEADLVDALRERPGALSLVAREGEEVIGHLLLTAATVEAGAAPWQALGLGPMAVAPPRQRRGVGSALVRTALERARAAGAELIVVLGHPEYYPRFGFAPAARLGLRCKWPVPDEAFMALELAPGAAARRGGGLVRYDRAFDAV